MTERPAMPLSRLCGTGKRRIRRKNHRADHRIEEERIPEWLVRQAKEAKKRGTNSA